MKKSILINSQGIKTESDYLELERLSLKLGIPVPMVRIQVKAELNGKVTDLYEGRSHTWTRNYWNMLFASICGLPLVVTNFGAGYLSGKQTGGAVSAYGTIQNLSQSPYSVAANSAYGLIPGRGTTAENFESYALATPITHGTGANQLGFRAPTQTGAYTAGSLLWTATLARLFDNTSGNSIVVTESAIYAYATQSAWALMNCRDLLASSVTVLNTGVLTITYTITLTFPA